MPLSSTTLSAAGIKASDSDKLVAFRIHGVTPEMVRSLRQAGYNPDADTLIAMRIHGATPEWIAQLKKDGYDHVSLDDLIAFRIHGVSPEFIEKLRGLGYTASRPGPADRHEDSRGDSAVYRGPAITRHAESQIDQLVAMKIHGID